MLYGKKEGELLMTESKQLAHEQCIAERPVTLEEYRRRHREYVEASAPKTARLLSPGNSCRTSE